MKTIGTAISLILIFNLIIAKPCFCAIKFHTKSEKIAEETKPCCHSRKAEKKPIHKQGCPHCKVSRESGDQPVSRCGSRTSDEVIVDRDERTLKAIFHAALISDSENTETPETGLNQPEFNPAVHPLLPVTVMLC